MTGDGHLRTYELAITNQSINRNEVMGTGAARKQTVAII